MNWPIFVYSLVFLTIYFPPLCSSPAVALYTQKMRDWSVFPLHIQFFMHCFLSVLKAAKHKKVNMEEPCLLVAEVLNYIKASSDCWFDVTMVNLGKQLHDI